MEKLNFRVVTPKGIELNESCETVNLNTVDSKIGILPMHIPLITVLKKGKLRFVKEGKEIFLRTEGGIAKIKDNIITVITQSFQFINKN